MEDRKYQKAIAVLAAEALPDIEDWLKKDAAIEHMQTVIMVDCYNLPFKVLKEYLQKYKNDNSVVHLNRCYPLPGYRIADLMKVDYDELILKASPQDKMPALALSKERESEAMFIAAKQHQWQLCNEQWKYFFAHLLNAAQFDEYTYFDYFGKKPAPNEAVTQGQQDRINFWKNLQKIYRKNPQNYMQEEPPYLPEYKGKYTMMHFYIKGPITDKSCDM